MVDCNCCGVINFFIVNNTRSVPESGPYPPGFTDSNHPSPDKGVSSELDFTHK